MSTTSSSRTATSIEKVNSLISTTQQMVSWLSTTPQSIATTRRTVANEKDQDIEMSTINHNSHQSTNNSTDVNSLVNLQNNNKNNNENNNNYDNSNINTNNPVNHVDTINSVDNNIDVNNNNGNNNTQSTCCVVCLSKPADCVIQDCGHLCCCIHCALSITRQSRGQCPLCRTKLTILLHLKQPPFKLSNGKTIAVSDVTYYAPTALRSRLLTQQQQQQQHSQDQLIVEHRLIAATKAKMNYHESIYSILC